MSQRNFPALGVLLLLVAGCGLKGPLYSPDHKPEEVAAPAEPASGTAQPRKRQTTPTPAPQSDKVPQPSPAGDTASPTTPPANSPGH